MKLDIKKSLVARTLNVGKSRIVFNLSRLNEIKEAITKQDIKDLLKDGAIIVKEIKGRRTKQKRKTRRRAGSRRKIVNKRKEKYILLTRKLRRHLLFLKRKGEISQEQFIRFRKEIRASLFKSLAQIKERIGEQK